MSRVESVDAYIAALTEAQREVAEAARAAILAAVPDASEVVRYDMPAYQLNGNSFLFFAMWKKHVGLYAVYPGDDPAFEGKVAPYRAKKDTLQFPLHAPLPLDLIAEVAGRARNKHQSF